MSEPVDFSQQALEGQIRQAAVCSSAEMNQHLYSTNDEVLQSLIRNPNFTQGEARRLLARKDLNAKTIQTLGEQEALFSSYPIKLALLKNPKTPVFLSLQQLRFIYLFDLVAICLLPAIPPEVKRAAEEFIRLKIPKMPIGQRITLARRGPPRIVVELLVGQNSKIIDAVLDNPYLTEVKLLQVVSRADCSQRVLESVAVHQKWSLRYPLRLAMLRHSQLSLALAMRLLPNMRPGDLRTLAQDSRINPQLRQFLNVSRHSSRRQ